MGTLLIDVNCRAAFLGVEKFWMTLSCRSGVELFGAADNLDFEKTHNDSFSELKTSILLQIPVAID